MSAVHDQIVPSVSPLSRSLSAGHPEDVKLQGWHPEDVKAAVRKKGITLSALGERHGFSAAYLRNALQRPLYEGEQIIARFIGVPAEEIWPDRYDVGGDPNYRRWHSARRAQGHRRAA